MAGWRAATARRPSGVGSVRRQIRGDMGPTAALTSLILLALSLSAGPAWAGEGVGPGAGPAPDLPRMAVIRTFKLAPGPGVALWDCAGGPNVGCKVVARFETRTDGRPPLSWTRVRGKEIDGWVLDLALEPAGGAPEGGR
jgi:hypothetical protein